MVSINPANGNNFYGNTQKVNLKSVQTLKNDAGLLVGSGSDTIDITRPQDGNVGEPKPQGWLGLIIKGVKWACKAIGDAIKKHYACIAANVVIEGGEAVVENLTKDEQQTQNNNQQTQNNNQQEQRG